GRDGLLRGRRRADGNRRPCAGCRRLAAGRGRLCRLLPRRTAGAVARPDAAGCARRGLCYFALPLGQWGDNWPGTWPEGVQLQLHILDGDEDYEIAHGLAATVPGADLFVYPGTEHYFAEQDEEAAALLRERVLKFLGWRSFTVANR